MALSHSVIKLCYAMEDSARYRASKSFLYDLLENPKAPVRPYFDVFMIGLVLASVWMLIYEVRHDMGDFSVIFEIVVVTIFITEYLLRFWVFNDSHKVILQHYERAEYIDETFQLKPALLDALRKKLKYTIRPMAIIDLLAIIPSYRPLRFLRVFLLFRLFKLFRYTRSISEFIKVLSEKRIELLTLFIFMGFIVFVAATVLYFFEVESGNQKVGSFFDSVYWALVTMSTVGYGDITPLTVEGRAVTMALIIAGLGVISFFTSIIVSAFGDKIHEIREHRILSEIERKGIDTVICGFGRVGQVVALRLADQKSKFVVIDPKEANIRQAKQKGYLAVEGDGENSELLQNLGLATKVKRLLCLTGDDLVNVYITLSARQMNANLEIISRANYQDNTTKLKRAGANHCVAPYEVVGLVAAEYIGQPVAFEALYGLLSGQSDIGIDAIKLGKHMGLEGLKLARLELPRRKLIPFGIVREGFVESTAGPLAKQLEGNSFYFNPDDNFVLQANDMVVIIGHEYSVMHLRDSLERGAI